MNYLDWARENTVFEYMAAQRGDSITLTGVTEPVEFRGSRVSPRYFDIFGIRAALGAGAADVPRFILRGGAALLGIGLVIGFGGVLGLTRLLESLLFGVGSRGPMTIGTAAAILALAALAACYIPARRAAKADPRIALRYE